MIAMTKKGLFVFELFILALVTFFVLWATHYNERARLVPLLIGLPILVLILFQMAVDHVPALERFQPKKVQITSIDKDALTASHKPKRTDQEIHRREFVALSWIIGLGVAITVFGFYMTIPVYLFSYLCFVAGMKRRMSFIGTFLMMVFIYIAFVAILDVRFYQGMILDN